MKTISSITHKKTGYGHWKVNVLFTDNTDIYFTTTDSMLIDSAFDEDDTNYEASRISLTERCLEANDDFVSRASL